MMAETVRHWRSMLATEAAKHDLHDPDGRADFRSRVTDMTARMKVSGIRELVVALGGIQSGASRYEATRALIAVWLPKRNPRTPKLSAADIRVLAALDMRIQTDNARELATWGRSLSAGYGVTASALEDATGLSRRAVTAALRHLIQAGKVEGTSRIAEVSRKVGPAGGGAGNFRARTETRQAADPRYRLKGA